MVVLRWIRLTCLLVFLCPELVHTQRVPIGVSVGSTATWAHPGLNEARTNALPLSGTNIFAGTTGEGRLHEGVTQSWSTEEIKNADTGTESNFLTADERATLVLINLARLYPKKFAECYLQPYRGLFDGNVISRPGRINVMTFEGVDAVTECIDDMNAGTPVQAMTPSAGLSRAARDHTADQGPLGETGHEGSNGSSHSERVSRYGKWGICCGENISYGHEDPTEIVIQLLVDDGVPSRGHRKNLLNGSFKRVGVAIGSHDKYGHMCVMDFAGSYTENGAGK